MHDIELRREALRAFERGRESQFFAHGEQLSLLIFIRDTVTGKKSQFRDRATGAGLGTAQIRCRVG